MDVEGGSVRARQRLETRKRLVEAARSLVAVKGYSGTTVAQIAEGAGVTERTFFRYFESKTDLFLSSWHEIAGSMESAMRELPAVTPVYDMVLAGLTEFASRAQELIDREEPRSMEAFAQNVPVLAMLETVLALEESLSITLAWRLGLNPGQVQLRSIANASVGVLRASVRSYSVGDRTTSLAEAVAANMELLRPIYGVIDLPR